MAATVWPRDVVVLRDIRRAAENGFNVETLVPLLLDRLHNSDEWSQQSIVETLAAIGDRRAVGPLCRLLARGPRVLPEELGDNPHQAAYAHAVVAHEDDALRRSVVQALHAIGDPAAVAVLLHVSANPLEPPALRAAASTVSTQLSMLEPSVSDG